MLCKNNLLYNDRLGGGFDPFEKYARQIGSFPRGENKKQLKPPSRLYFCNFSSKHLKPLSNIVLHGPPHPALSQ